MQTTEPKNVDVFNNDHNYSKQNWQSVPSSNKRQSNSGILLSTKKTCFDSGSTIKLSNSFEILSSNDNVMDVPTDKENETNRPPPIFIPDITNVRSMVVNIEKVISKDDYSYKCMNRNKVKVNAVSIKAYRAVVKLLTELNVSFHTYQIKKERAYRVVLKNMHYSNETAEIKNAIEAHGHAVRNISNLKSFKTKDPLSIFFVDLEPGPTNKDIFNIEFLLNAKIVFEPPKKSNDVVQCKKCQRYGHTKTYCRHPSRCVKCGLHHDTSTCQKPKTTPPKCVLCDGEHPANYKGCSVYRDIKNKSFPPLRNKVLNKNKTDHSAIPSPPSSQHGTSRTYTSYANVVSNNQESNKNEATLSQTITGFFEKFETLMSQQAQQIGTLMNLLSTVISKLQ